jgi:hypothetical protein
MERQEKCSICDQPIKIGTRVGYVTLEDGTTWKACGMCYDKYHDHPEKIVENRHK